MATPPMTPPMAGNQPPMADPAVPEAPEAPTANAQQKICIVPLGDDTYKVYTEPYEAPAESPIGEAGPGMDTDVGDGDESGTVEGMDMMLKTVMGMVQELESGETPDEQMNEGFGGPPKGGPMEKKPY